jgi:endonuclease YncB( thermonuclease family)
MVILEVRGVIDLNQFWPSGESDADTVNVVIGDDNAFSYREQDGENPKTTHVFDDAKVHGSEGVKPAIRVNRENQKHLTIRLQGIDAPELHYQPAPLSRKDDSITPAQREKFHQFNKKYRQYLGETAAVRLGAILNELAGGGGGVTTIDCIVRTLVDSPNDVFDTYGRFIGDIIIQKPGDAAGSQETNINLWLAKEGWAFPTFYASMTQDEINTFLSATSDARTKRAGIWEYYADEIGDFDFDLLFRGKGAQPNPDNDKGDVIMPKLFRRYTTFSAYKKAGISTDDFKSYLSQGRDSCFKTDEFLEQGPTASSAYFFNEFIDEMKFSVKPQDLVFTEKPSKLTDSDGNLIKSWTSPELRISEAG